MSNPQLNIKPPNSAIVEPSKCNVDAETVADFIDMAGVLSIPVDDVKVVLQQAGDEQGRQWLALVYDCIQVLGSARGEVDVSVEACICGSYKAKECIHGPRPSSCNTNKYSDRLVTPSVEVDKIVNVPQQHNMLISSVSIPGGRKVTCARHDVMLFDGCGTHTTLGYMLPEYGLTFRRMFDAALALLHNGAHFVSGAKLNHAVLPTESIAKAHSYMIDLNRVFMPDDVRLHHWVGEFSLPLTWESLSRQFGTRRRGRSSEWFKRGL